MSNLLHAHSALKHTVELAKDAEELANPHVLRELKREEVANEHDAILRLSAANSSRPH